MSSGATIYKQSSTRCEGECKEESLMLPARRDKSIPTSSKNMALALGIVALHDGFEQYNVR